MATLGGGIAQTLALAGFRVTPADVDADTARRLRDGLLDQLVRHTADGRVAAAAADRAAELIIAAASVEQAVADADHGSEAVPEDLELNRSVLTVVGGAVRRAVRDTAVADRAGRRRRSRAEDVRWPPRHPGRPTGRTGRSS